MNDRPHAQQEERVSNVFAELVSNFLLRWRKVILISIVAIVVILIGWGIYHTIASHRLQNNALKVYQLRKAFLEWQEAHPQSLLTAAKNLESSDEKLDLDEATKNEREASEQKLLKLIQQGIDTPQKNIQAWAYWTQARKARHLKENKKFQDSLLRLIDLKEPTFHKLAQLHLASFLYSEGNINEAVLQWHELADIDEPQPEQLVASIYLANYFSRNGQKDDAIRYWQQVESLGDELLQINGVDDQSSFLGGSNLIAGSFQDALKTWQAMAKNQLLFLQSEKIQIAADHYDETIEPDKESSQDQDVDESADSSDVSFNVPSGESGLGVLPINTSNIPLSGGLTEEETEGQESIEQQQ